MSIFRVAHARRARAHPRHGAVPIDITADDRADDSLLERVRDQTVVARVAALGASHDRETLLAGELRGSNHQAHARSIYRHALLGENVLAGLHGSHRVHGTERERRGEDHDVRVARHHVLVTARAAERIFLVEAEALRDLLRLLDEEVGRRDNLDLDVAALFAQQFGGLVDVAEGAVATSTASHYAHLEDARRALGLDDCRRAHYSGGANLEEVSTIHLLFPFFTLHSLTPLPTDGAAWRTSSRGCRACQRCRDRWACSSRCGQSP